MMAVIMALQKTNLPASMMRFHLLINIWRLLQLVTHKPASKSTDPAWEHHSNPFENIYGKTDCLPKMAISPCHHPRHHVTRITLLSTPTIITLKVHQEARHLSSFWSGGLRFIFHVFKGDLVDRARRFYKVLLIPKGVADILFLLSLINCVKKLSHAKPIPQEASLALLSKLLSTSLLTRILDSRFMVLWKAEKTKFSCPVITWKQFVFRQIFFNQSVTQ